MRLKDHVARMRDERNTYKLLVGEMKKTDQFENLGVDWIHLAEHSINRRLL
jgi:hypothetical protein